MRDFTVRGRRRFFGSKDQPNFRVRRHGSLAGPATEVFRFQMGNNQIEGYGDSGGVLGLGGRKNTGRHFLFQLSKGYHHRATRQLFKHEGQRQSDLHIGGERLLDLRLQGWGPPAQQGL